MIASTLHHPGAVAEFRRRWRIDPHRIRRLRYALYGNYLPLETALRELGAAASAAAEAFDLEPLRIISRQESAHDGSTKLALEARDGARVETVLLRAITGRTSVCVSTQVGCRAGCPFCATARMGLLRPLHAHEIIAQVRLAGTIAREYGRRVRNVVFMGMGEPLDNEAAVNEALDYLSDAAYFALPPRRIMISTVGIPDAMIRFVERHPHVQMALSLHSARPEVRARLIPWSRRHSWQELHEALRYCATRHHGRPKQGPIMIEHLMLDGVNDGPDDAHALIDYLHGIPSHINLIPYNPIPDRPAWQSTSWERRDGFAKKLRSAGFFTTIRFSMGNDIQAACGQLVQEIAS
ncbi:MAG TPA: 23S rRNA (adenine(2503)-C(2))-methyltransferase RlmN [Pirellulaceae bacterium]